MRRRQNAAVAIKCLRRSLPTPQSRIGLWLGVGGAPGGVFSVDWSRMEWNGVEFCPVWAGLLPSPSWCPLHHSTLFHLEILESRSTARPQITPKYGAISFATQRIDCRCHRCCCCCCCFQFDAFRFIYHLSLKIEIAFASRLEGFCLSFISMRFDSIRFVFVSFSASSVLAR